MSELKMLTRTNRFEKAWAFFALMLVVASVLFIRLFCAFTFPIPWSDESDFIAPAFELSRNGTLFVSGMNPDRVVMWMPPGYMLLLGGVFKAFGYSFDLARWTSALIFIAAYGVNLVIVLRNLRGAALIVALAASLIAFLSPYSLAIANIARMEAFYTSTLLLALAVTIFGRPWVGFALVLVTGLIHFNAVYFVIPFFAHFVDQWLRYRSIKIDRVDIVALFFAAFLLFAYAVYVIINWHGFVDDMRFQFGFKSMTPAFFGTKGKIIAALVYVIVVLQWVMLRRFTSSVFVAGFGAGFVLLYLYGKNMWYAYAECLGFYLLFVGGVMALNEMAVRWRRLIISAMVVLSAASLIYFSIFRITPQFAPLWLRSELIGRDFVASAELDKVSRFIKSAAPGARFCFGHSGMEPFFFQQLADAKQTWLYIGHSVTQLQPLRRVDYRVRCDSALLPEYILMFDVDGFPHQRKDVGCDIFAL